MDSHNSLSIITLVLFVLLLSNTLSNAQLSTSTARAPMRLPPSELLLGNLFHVNTAWQHPSFASIFTTVLFRVVMRQSYWKTLLLPQGSRMQILTGSARGYGVIEAAKSEVERICPGVVSCADILVVAARDASAYVGGPSWTVQLGKRDSTTASQNEADSDLPSFRDDLPTVISTFERKGLNARDMVALSGAHTLGQAQCSTFRERIYSNGTNIDAGFASTRRRRCPAANNDGDSNLAPLDLVTPNSFDNNYYRNLIQRRGLLQSDQVLFNGGSTNSIVSEYSDNPSRFSSDFKAAMVKMGDIRPLTGQDGVIRRICSASVRKFIFPNLCGQHIFNITIIFAI